MSECNYSALGFSLRKGKRGLLTLGKKDGAN